ncbi:hypothetical protein ACWC4J_39155, partial [Streptomyces sp. NPDC001356]
MPTPDPTDPVQVDGVAGQAGGPRAGVFAPGEASDARTGGVRVSGQAEAPRGGGVSGQAGGPRAGVFAPGEASDARTG